MRLFILCLLTSLRMLFGGLSHGAAKPNVLFIAIDDLACSLGCYGHPQVKSPRIDRLASRGVRFDRAYNQLPLCNPSRASLMTGLRPDVIKVYDLDRHFRDEVPNVITLPQLFRKHGWFAARVGKIYHYNVPAGIGTNGLDDEPSWDRVVNPKGRDTVNDETIFNAEPHRPISAALSWRADDGPDGEQTDGMIATDAIKLLEQHRDQPFFLGVGFFRPHTPYVAPKKYFDQYPMRGIKLPYSPANDRDDIPPGAFAHNCPIPNYGLAENICLEALRAYYASVSFVDAQVGRLLDALDRLKLADNTIVVLWSDHGYHLGEHLGAWQKRTLFEESARAPLIIFAPGAKGNGRSSKQIVEFVDIYPTVADLARLEPPANLSGRSLRPLLEDPDRAWKGAAFTQVLRPGDDAPFVGRSVRTDRWRYSDWGGPTGGVELYDHENDPNEWTNLGSNPMWQPIVRDLKRQLDAKINANVPRISFNPKRL